MPIENPSNTPDGAENFSFSPESAEAVKKDEQTSAVDAYMEILHEWRTRADAWQFEQDNHSWEPSPEGLEDHLAEERKLGELYRQAEDAYELLSPEDQNKATQKRIESRDGRVIAREKTESEPT